MALDTPAGKGDAPYELRPAQHVRVFERGVGIPVVIVTGACDCADSWTHIVKQASTLARLVTYDGPGPGSAPHGPAPSVDHYLNVAGNGEPVVLVGHSLEGSLHALCPASRNGGRARHQSPCA